MNHPSFWWWNSNILISLSQFLLFYFPSPIHVEHRGTTPIVLGETHHQTVAAEIHLENHDGILFCSALDSLDPRVCYLNLLNLLNQSWFVLLKPQWHPPYLVLKSAKFQIHEITKYHEVRCWFFTLLVLVRKFRDSFGEITTSSSSVLTIADLPRKQFCVLFKSQKPPACSTNLNGSQGAFPWRSTISTS